MGVYDGNQLPEQPTSQFQMAVSVLYTLFVSVMVGIGAFAVLAAQQKPDKEATANLYMRMLLLKHNAVAHGILAFIPATYSLTHLYTSSLHNGSLYSASNIVYVAVFGFAAKYLGEALQALREDATHMDTIKAVYECLYMLTRSYARLRLHTPAKGQSVLANMLSGATPANRTVQLEPPGRPAVADREPGEKVDVQVENLHGGKSAGSSSGTSWLSPGWVLLNVFLAVGCQDDSRLWVMLPKWSLRWTWCPNVLDHFVPGTDSPGHRLWLWLRRLLGPVFWCSSICWPPKADMQRFDNTCCAGGQGCNCYHCCGAHSNCAYAYWLYSQGDCVRNFTGSLITKQSIAEKLNQASYTTSRLYTTARRFLTIFAKHFQDGLEKQYKFHPELTFTFRDEGQVTFSEAVSCLRAVKFDCQALNMTCERYMCRLTPAAAATCLPAKQLLPALYSCWQVLFGARDAAVLLQRLGTKDMPAGQETYLEAVTSEEAGYWCCLWLQYMHMVLLGIDLLRMHNNRDLLDDTKQEKGFYDTLDPAKLQAAQEVEAITAAAAAAAKAAAEAEAAAAAAAAASKKTNAVDEVATVAAAAAAAVALKAKKEHPAGLDCPTLHNLCDDNLHRFAALVASLLLAQQMATEAGRQGPKAASKDLNVSSLGIDFTAKTPSRDQDVLPAEAVVSHALLQKRSQLVRSHSSLPGIVEGVNCLPPSDWVDSLQSPLAAALVLVAVTSISIATIACSNGVQLVTIAGSVQAFAAWALLTYISRLPVAAPPPSREVCLPWLAQQLMGMLGMLVDVVLKLLITLASLLNLMVPAEMLTLLAGICCCCCFRGSTAGPSSNLCRAPTAGAGASGTAGPSSNPGSANVASSNKSPSQVCINIAELQTDCRSPSSAEIGELATRAGSAALAAAGASALAAVCTHAASVYKVIGYSNCTCKFDLETELEDKLSKLMSAATNLLAMAAAAELQYIRAAAAGVGLAAMPADATLKPEGGTEDTNRDATVDQIMISPSIQTVTTVETVTENKTSVTLKQDDKLSNLKVPVCNKELGHVEAGLENQGNTCYLDSVLQYLSHLPYLREAVYQIPVSDNDQPSESLALALQSIFYNLQQSSTVCSTAGASNAVRCESTVDFTKAITDKWRSGGKPPYNPVNVYEQQDAYEFNSWLLEQLQDKLKGTAREAAVNHLIEGQYSTCITCPNTNDTSNTHHRFPCLQLEVKKDHNTNVYDSFDEFTATIEMTGKYITERHGLQDATRDNKFDSLPPLLQLHLKRFGADAGRPFKINTRLEFFDQLDLDKDDGKYLSPQADRRVRNLYTLHSVLVHRGNVGRGHYYAYIRPDGKRWFLFDDTTVRPVDEKEAFDQVYGWDTHTAQPKDPSSIHSAYMLMYVRASDWERIMNLEPEKDMPAPLKRRLQAIYDAAQCSKRNMQTAGSNRAPGSIHSSVTVPNSSVSTAGNSSNSGAVGSAQTSTQAAVNNPDSVTNIDGEQAAAVGTQVSNTTTASSLESGKELLKLHNGRETPLKSAADSMGADKQPSSGEDPPNLPDGRAHDPDSQDKLLGGRQDPPNSVDGAPANPGSGKNTGIPAEHLKNINSTTGQLRAPAASQNSGPSPPAAHSSRGLCRLSCCGAQKASTLAVKGPTSTLGSKTAQNDATGNVQNPPPTVSSSNSTTGQLRAPAASQNSGPSPPAAHSSRASGLCRLSCCGAQKASTLAVKGPTSTLGSKTAQNDATGNVQNPPPTVSSSNSTTMPLLQFSTLQQDFCKFVKDANHLLYTGFVGRHVHLGFLMDDENGVLYAGRFSGADVSLYAFVALSLVGFVVCAVLALLYEPYYATGTGMCLGRCHNMTDCRANLTVGLPGYEGGQPGCPSQGVVAFSPSRFSDSTYQQCPFVYKRT